MKKGCLFRQPLFVTPAGLGSSPANPIPPAARDPACRANCSVNVYKKRKVFAINKDLIVTPAGLAQLPPGQPLWLLVIPPAGLTNM